MVDKTQEDKAFSIDDLNAVEAGSNPFEFEFTFNNGKKSGIFFKVYGSESEHVAVETAVIMAEEMAREQAAIASGQQYKRDNNRIGKRLAAVRLAGWRGIKEECNKANAEKLCLSNVFMADQIMQKSNALENFIKL